MLSKLSVIVMLMFLLGSFACRYEKVRPWEREMLAQEQMRLIPDTLENATDEHIYFSKEAASGGQGVGGGGCGCN